MRHGRASGSVKLHSWIAALGQQDAEAEPGRLGVLELTRRRWPSPPQIHRRRRTTVRMLTDSAHPELPYSQMGSSRELRFDGVSRRSVLEAPR
jgi:hypothetical protein